MRRRAPYGTSSNVASRGLPSVPYRIDTTSGPIREKENTVGLLDKLKEGAGQAKDMAVQAAERAKDEAKELNLKRQVNNEEEALGAKVFELVERGELTHADLTAGVEKIRSLKAEIEALAAEQASGSDSESESAPTPPAA
jgi:hypothetical protein